MPRPDQPPLLFPRHHADGDINEPWRISRDWWFPCTPVRMSPNPAKCYMLHSCRRPSFIDRPQCWFCRLAIAAADARSGLPEKLRALARGSPDETLGPIDTLFDASAGVA